MYGRVLELGSGTGVNLSFYPEEVECVHAVDLRETMLERTNRKAADLFPDGTLCFKGYVGDAQSLPFGDGEYDCTLITLLMCTVEEPERVLEEAVRVTRKGGTVAFIEHQLPKRAPQGLLFRALAPVWKAPSGCSLTRETEDLLRSSPGLRIEKLNNRGPLLGYPFIIGWGTRL